jgi:hypothetical protein
MIHRGKAEAFVIAALLLGVVSMCQPFSIALFRIGFFVTLLATVAFIVVSHLTERPRRP